MRRRALAPEYSLIWLACGLVLLVLSVWRELLHLVAGWVGVHYPPAVLLLMLIVFVFVAAVGFSIVLSRHQTEIQRLSEEVALLTARQAGLDGEGGSGGGDDQ